MSITKERCLSPEEKNYMQELYRDSTLFHTLKAQLDTQIAQGIALEDVQLDINFVDIDGTLTGDPATACLVREEWATRHIPVVAVTSRTEEMCMTSSQFYASTENGQLQRPFPHLAPRDEEGNYPAAETVTNFHGAIDFDDIFAQTGGVHYVLQADGSYLKDEQYEGVIRGNSGNWREETLALLKDIFQLDDNFQDPQGLIELVPIEFRDNFDNGITDAAPLEYRVQIKMSKKGIIDEVVTAMESQDEQIETTGATRGSSLASRAQQRKLIERKEQFLAKIDEYRRKLGEGGYNDEVAKMRLPYDEEYHSIEKELETTGNKEAYYEACRELSARYQQSLSVLQEQYGLTEKFQQLRNIRIMDDSNPEYSSVGVYLIPRRSGKDRAMRRGVRALHYFAEKHGLRPDQIRKHYHGDSPPDLGALYTLEAGDTIVLERESRLSKAVLNAHRRRADKKTNVHFAGQRMNALGRRMERLKATDEDGNTMKGVYSFRQPLTSARINVVVADKTYQNALPEVGSVYAYVKNPVVYLEQE